jgi:DNA mismatch repair protein MutS
LPREVLHRSMYDEYIQKWKTYANQYGEKTCLFYMVGKFYELYDILDKKTGEGQTNVKQAVEALGITLTTREKDGPKGENCLFAGFPEQSLQKFAGLLTREGWTVVVCDQEKNTQGRVTDRPIARIFSPGTHIELAGADAPYLAGLWFQEQAETAPLVSAAVLDLTTGHLLSYESKTQGNADVWSADELVHFFQIHNPRETIVWWRGAAIARPTEAIFRRRCGLIKGSVHLEMANQEQQGAFESAIHRKAYLEKIFTSHLCLLPVLEQLQLQAKPLTERLLVSLLRFAEDHLPSAVQNLYNHTTWIPEQSVYMGNNSLAQLNYLQTGSEQSVLSLFGKTFTSLGKRAIRERLLSPLSDRSTIQTRLNEVGFAFQMTEEFRKPIESSLRLIHDLARLHRRIVMGTVNASDILALDTSYGCIQEIDTKLGGSLLSLTKEQRASFQDYKKLFRDSFDIEKAKKALSNEDLSFLPQDKAPRTFEAEQRLADMRKRVEDTLETVRQWVGLPPDAIRLESQETSSYVFTATKTTLGILKKKLTSTPQEQHPFPGMTVHEKKSTRGSLDFPLLDTFHYQTFHLRSQLQHCIKDELYVICKSVHHPAWATLEEWVGHVDATLTLANVANERGYVKPELVESSDAGVSAKGLRHPLLESIQSRVDYVKHSVSLGFDSELGWLLYGMNASGKSSLMKAIGISVLLAQAGSFVPASDFKLKPFRSVFTRILNTDSLWAGLSSFAVEMSELRDIFQKVDGRSLVLGDELCSGTESVSATSLVAAGIQYLHSKQSRFVFATHLHDLMKLPEIATLPHLGIWHLRVHYEPATDKLIYDRSLHRGPGGTLYGLEVAKAMHIPHELLKEAHKFRRALLGEVAAEEAESSRWNSQILRYKCEVCNHSITRELEVHHIQPRKDATQGKFQDGSSMNDLRNLIVVCQMCHDKHHAGELQIGPQIQTSSGVQRVIEARPVQETPAKSKWSMEEIATIEQTLRTQPHSPLSRLVYELKQEHDIIISPSTLGKMRQKLA